MEQTEIHSRILRFTHAYGIEVRAGGMELRAEPAYGEASGLGAALAECHERLYRDREPLRKLTAAERVLEDVVPEVT